MQCTFFFFSHSCPLRVLLAGRFLILAFMAFFIPFLWFLSATFQSSKASSKTSTSSSQRLVFTTAFGASGSNESKEYSWTCWISGFSVEDLLEQPLPSMVNVGWTSIFFGWCAGIGPAHFVKHSQHSIFPMSLSVHFLTAGPFWKSAWTVHFYASQI